MPLIKISTSDRKTTKLISASDLQSLKRKCNFFTEVNICAQN